MRSPALAIGWEIWAKHRLGLSLLAAWGAAAAVLVRVLPPRVADDLVIIPSIIASVLSYHYLLWVFSYAEGTLAGNGDGFPRRNLALPVRTTTLVTWPMLYGMLAVALAWIWLAWLILQPREGEIPAWPAVMFAASLAAFQAVCWTVVRAPLGRVVIAVVGLPLVLIFAALLWARFRIETPPAIAVAASLVVIGVAYVAAVTGVAFDRHGKRLSFTRLSEILSPVWPRLAGGRAILATPVAAQRWIEVRRDAWIGPVLLVTLVSFAALAAGHTPHRVEVGYMVILWLGLPPLVALFLGLETGKSRFWSGDLNLSSFLATRPLPGRALASAKFYSVVRLGSFTWVALLLAIPLLVVLMGKAEALWTILGFYFPAISFAPLIFGAALALGGLVGLVWLQFAAGVCAAVSGRVAAVNGTAIFYVIAVGLLGRAAFLVNDPLTDQWTLQILIAVLWSVGACLLVLKAIATGTVVRLFWHDGSLSVLFVWLSVVACFLLPLYTMVPETRLPRSLVALYVVLALPLNRPLLLAAALEWNRHR